MMRASTIRTAMGSSVWYRYRTSSSAAAERLTSVRRADCHDSEAELEIMAARKPMVAATMAATVRRIATPVWPLSWPRSWPAPAISETATAGDLDAVLSSISPAMGALATVVVAARASL